MKVQNALLIAGVILSTASTATAGWVLYSREGGSWKPNGVYQNLQVCEAEAKALAESQKVVAGCALPSPHTTQPNTYSSFPTTTVDSYTCKDKLRKWNQLRAARHRAFGETMSNNEAFAEFAQRNPECVK